MATRKSNIDVEAYEVDGEWSYRLILDDVVELYVDVTYPSISKAMNAAGKVVNKLKNLNKNSGKKDGTIDKLELQNEGVLLGVSGD